MHRHGSMELGYFSTSAIVTSRASGIIFHNKNTGTHGFDYYHNKSQIMDWKFVFIKLLLCVVLIRLQIVLHDIC